jgi:two-component system sensor histidine kinase DctS
MQPSPPPASLDFALLQQTLPSQGLRSRRTLWLLLGMLLLVIASVVALVLYLQNFERAEENRRRVVDGQWLEQSVRFHFNRLEEDLLVLARQAVNGGPLTPPTRLQGGLLWSEPGAVLWDSWLPKQASPTAPDWSRAAPDNALSHPANADTLASMLDIAVGLRRSAYGGPLKQADGNPSDVVWLAVPLYERGQLLGTYVAALSMQACVKGLVPRWFHQQHAIQLTGDGEDTPVDDNNDDFNPHLVPMNLPGTDLFIQMTPLTTQPAVVPRIFLSVAIVFLLGMLASLWALRRDIRKRQQVQAMLQTQVALRTAMESSVTIGLRAWTRDGQILYVNQAFCRMVGYNANELVGQTAPLPYWPPDHTDELNAVHLGIISQGTEHTGVEVQFQHRNGRRVDVLIHEAPLTTASGEHIGWMSSILDISERKRAQQVAEVQQQKLEASGRLVAMGEVASTLAHELNQPLGALSSFANGLVNRLHSHSITLDEVVPVVERMAKLSERAGNIIQRVNAFARRRELSRQMLDLSAFIKRVTAVSASAPGVTLLPLPDEGRLWVLADSLLLEHVVLNLVANAVDWAAKGQATEPQVRLWLDMDHAQHTASFNVADSGPGVPEDDRERIFSAFFSTKDGGMGMGLAICRSIVEAHHGRIDVIRDPDLGGARFVIWLPLTTPPADASGQPDAATAAPRT